VALGNIPIYPGVLRWLGIVREQTAGVPLVPVVTHPLNQNEYDPEDMPRFLDDKAVRGSMVDLFYKTLGVESAQFSLGGPNFLDSHGYFFDNLFGDLSTVGSSLANPSTTSGALAVGATNMTLSAAPPAAYTAGATIQIGAGATAEVVIISSTAASNVINWGTGTSAYPLRFTHPTAQTVQTCGTPFTHKWAALNSPLGYGGAYGAQPPTHTLCDVTNIVNTFTSATYGTAPTNTFGARLYPSAVVKDISFAGTVDQLLGIKLTGESFLSQVAGTAVTNVTTNSRPLPNWNSTVSILGTNITQIGNYTLTPKRGTQVYWTLQGTQTPDIIARGPLTMDGTIEWEPTQTEQPLDMMLLNAQGPMVITATNAGIPNAGAPFTLTFTMSQVANIKSKIVGHGIAIGYQNSFECVSNASDVGGSGGLGPGTITLTNNTAVYSATDWMVNEGITSRRLHLL
jgi:hypothetical protein